MENCWGTLSPFKFSQPLKKKKTFILHVKHLTHCEANRLSGPALDQLELDELELKAGMRLNWTS